MPTRLRPVAAGSLCAGHPEPCVSSDSNSRTGDPVDAAVLCVRGEARELSWPTSLFASRGPQPPWWDQHRCRAEGSRGAPDVWLPSSVCPCWAAAGVTSTVLLFLARPMTQERPCGRGATYKPGREASPETNRDGAFILDCSLQNSSVPAACTLSPALQGSGGQDTTGDNRASGGPTQAEASGPVEGQVCGSSRSRQPATAAAGRCHQGYTLHGAGRSPAPSELEACNFCSHPSCNCRSEPSCGLPGQAGSTRAPQAQPEQGRGWRSNRRLDDQLQRSYPLC
ncbi:uncharacterized protein LOC115892622 isoform X1 [Rhinopithecus roxellana]|uniref:uncharacterized protein LOC115892622 isoform X1 n=2 Tax=Rhinopithecus roxellana TaxID=61622 RepID=UPI00123751BD|nr:uncharacterized protein LOC115892622 isoform X1 [Rhinopithecus roxellana]